MAKTKDGRNIYWIKENQELEFITYLDRKYIKYDIFPNPGFETVVITENTQKDVDRMKESIKNLENKNSELMKLIAKSDKEKHWINYKELAEDVRKEQEEERNDL